MRITKLEIQRNTGSYPTWVLDHKDVKPGAVVGLVTLEGDNGAKVVTALTAGQVAAVLATVADGVAAQAQALGAAVQPWMVQADPTPPGWAQVDPDQAAAEEADLEASLRAQGLNVNPPAPNPEIQVGQRWRARNGDVVRITELDREHTNFPIAGQVEGENEIAGLRTYNRDGLYLEADLSDHDLVELIDGPAKEAPAPDRSELELEDAAAADQAEPKPEILVGQVWENRYGDKVEILNVVPVPIAGDDRYPVRGRYTGNRAPDGAKLDDQAFWTREGLWLEDAESGLDLVKLVKVDADAVG